MEPKARKMISAVSNATVPRISVVVRKAYGAGLYAMCGPGFEPDCSIALPQAMIAVMGPEGAARIIFRKDAEDPDKLKERTEEYRQKFANPFIAAGRGYIDDVIMPRNSRRRIARAFAMLEDKELQNPWRKHDNLPL